MTDENSVEEPEHTVRRQCRAGTGSQRQRRPSDDGEEDAAADERTSPFPYAEKFDEWVADETAASDGGRRGRARTNQPL